MRLMASQPPRKEPYFPMALEAYMEQLGVNRQWFPRKGLNISW
jgi:hypothetical protein